MDVGVTQPCPVARWDEPLTDRLLTEDELALRRRVREVVDESIAPGAEERWTEHQFAHEPCQALARAGLGGLVFPEELGGMGASTVAYAIAIEEVASVCASTSLVYMTQMHAGYPILIEGTDAQRRAYIPSLCDGSRYGALAITEPEAGSDVSSLRTTARREGDAYVLNGSKTFITTGDRADTIVCFATLDRSGGRDAVTAFIVDGDAPGVIHGPPLEKLGMHASSTAELFFEDVRVPSSARLGAEGGAWGLSMRTVVKSRISAASQGLGIARSAYELAVRWIADHGGLRAPEWQSDLFELAGLRARIVQGRLLLHAVARAADEDARLDLTAEVGMAKLTCTDLGVAASQLALHVLGAEADRTDVGAERLLRDAKVTQIYDGTNEIQRLLIARDTAKRLSALIA